MELKVSIFEAKAEVSPKDYYCAKLNDVSINTTLSKVFDLCWDQQSNGTFNWNSFNVVAIYRGIRHTDLNCSLSNLLGSSSNSGATQHCLHFVARNRHKPVMNNSQQLVEQTMLALKSAAIMPGGLLALCKAAAQLDAADVPGLGEDRRAQEIITDFRLQGVMLKRPKLLQQLVRQHPVLSVAIVTVVRRVQQAAQGARLPNPMPNASISVNMPPGANYNVDFESVLDDDDENNGESDDAAAGAALPQPQQQQRSRSRPSSSTAAAPASGAIGGQVSSNFLRQAMAQAFTLIPARQRFAVQLRALRDMGITDEEAALRLLEQNNGDLELTIDQLFS